MSIPFCTVELRRTLTRALRGASVICTLGVLMASPVFAQAPVLFGVDAKSVTRARSAGLPVHYGSAWAGAWNQKWGWGGVEKELQQAFAAGVTPVVHWWYWGDDISPACVENGCMDRYHGVRKDKATWTRLSTDLAALILRAGGPGAQAIVVLETEFNKNGIETYEPFDGYLAEQAAIFKAAGHKVVLGFGSWGFAHWDTFDRAVASADMLGTTALRSSLRDAETYHSVADTLIASARYFRTRFNKPTFVTDLAVSSYPAPEYETHQAAVIREVFDRIDELKALGVLGIVFRMWADDPEFDVNNYHGVAERHWGFLRSDGSPKPAFAVLRTGWLTEAELQPAPMPPPTSTPSTCASGAPAADWVCVNGGWLPPGHPLAIGAPTPPPIGTPAPTPASAPAATPTVTPTPSTSACVGNPPGAEWVCVDTGWLPPGHPLTIGAPTSAPTPTPTPTPAPTPTAGTCVGPAPVPGWVCLSNGGWVPPDHPLAIIRRTSD